MASLEVQQLTPDPINFGAGDLQRHLAEYNPADYELGLTFPAPQGPIARVPGRRNLTLQWATLEELGDPTAPDRYRTCTPEAAANYIDDYEAELVRLGTLDVTIPPHVTYLVPDDPHTGTATIYTAARQSKSNPAVHVYHSRDYMDPNTPSHLYDTVLALHRTVFRYFTERSFRPWRINAAQSLGTFCLSNRFKDNKFGRELLFFYPMLSEPETTAEDALSGMGAELSLMPVTPARDKLQEEVFLYGRRKLGW
jgi:hypothetical protein